MFYTTQVQRLLVTEGARIEKVPRVPGFKGAKGNKVVWIKVSTQVQGVLKD